MGGEQSKISSKTPTPNMRNRRVVDVGNFVTRYINDAFDALQEAGFMRSNCYHLLHMLTHSTMISNTFQAIQSRLFGVIPQGTTNIRNEFPIIYYRMFQRVLINTSNLNIGELLQYKQLWLRNPSNFVNAILGEPGARKIIAQCAEAQNNAINKVCDKSITPLAKSAGGVGEGCSMSTIFRGASPEQQNRCCICGLGEPPQLTDIEHVVSSQLLISLGICPGTKSLIGFRHIFDGLRRASRDNWVNTIINYFPDNNRDAVRSAFRSMMLPAHAHCNQVIKREWSPFYVDPKGNILANINMHFEDMAGQTYAQKVIEPSIEFVNSRRRQKGEPPKLSREGLNDYISKWNTKQQTTFKKIAWLLNSIDQRNNDASWFLFNNLYERAKLENNIIDRAAFAELVANILGLTKVINWDEIKSVLENDQNILKIKTTLTLLVQAILVLFQADVQTPEQMATPMNSGSDTEHSGSDADNEYSSQSSPILNSSTDDANSEGSFTSESELSELELIDIDKQATSSSDAESDTSNIKSQSSVSGTSSIMSNEFQNPTGNASKKRGSPIKQLDRAGRYHKFKQVRSNNPLIISSATDDAVTEYYRGSAISEVNRDNATRIATNAARNALNNVIDDSDPYDLAYNAAMVALIDYNNGNISPGLGGGSHKRTTRRRSTRKRRPSKKPRRTIRRQRRNKKGTQTRRK
jgi:hypothetical protein